MGIAIITGCVLTFALGAYVLSRAFDAGCIEGVAHNLFGGFF